MGIRRSEELVKSHFSLNPEGNPSGGVTRLPGANILSWQDGLIKDGEQNGVFVEDVLEAARQRLLFFNEHPTFRCRENSLAITKIEEALQWLDWRTRQRVLGNVENTYESH